VRFSKKFAAISIVAASALVAGGAFAYWTSTGSGTGSAATTAGVNGNLGFATDALTAMYPGDSAQTFQVTVTNNELAGGQNSYVAGVKAHITTDKVGCTGADFLLNGTPAPSTLATAAVLSWTPVDLAPQASQDTGNVTIQFNNTASNQNACKSAAVTLNYSV
jgi:hypothetical protein